MIEWELLLFFGAPLLWGGWQLYTLRRDRRAAARPPPALPPPDGPHPDQGE